MKAQVTAALIFCSVTAIAQPGKSKVEIIEDLSVSLKYKVFTDTLSGSIITYDKEGYLQRKPGKVIRKINVFENQGIKPELASVAYYLDNWTAVKAEDVYNFKAK